jgi:hypothetical protein
MGNDNIKTCAHRNCETELVNKRKDAKYCCRKCKVYERTYKKREEVFKKKSILYNEKIIEGVKKVKEMIEST